MTHRRRTPQRGIGKGDERAREAAQSLAVQALSYLAAEPERLGRFLAVSGLGPESIRAAAADPAFLAGVIEYIASDEPLLLDFAAEAQLKPATVMGALAALGVLWERDVP